MTLLEQLKDVKLVKSISEHDLILAWFGGHGIHVFNSEGKETYFFSVGDFKNNSTTEEQAKQGFEDYKKQLNRELNE